MTDVTRENNNTWTKQAVVTLLEGHLGHLRSIKELELAWLDRYSVLTLPAIGFLIAHDRSTARLPCSLLWIMVSAYLAITLWIQDVLRKERRSYYRVLRSVIRAENYLGLFDVNFLPAVMAGGAFPKGLGPNPSQDGTQPYASFLQRLIYTFIIYTSIVVSALYQNSALIPSIVLIAVDLVWLIVVFRRDKIDLRREALLEKGLAGTSPSWYPDTPKDSESNVKTE
jgi:hypothetical protein